MALREMKQIRWILSILYLLFIICAVGVQITMAGITALDDVIIPFGIFLAVTVLQAILFHNIKPLEKTWGKQLLISLLKGIFVFFFEFIWDCMNIHFGRESTILRSVFIITFLCIIALIAICESIFAFVLWTESKEK